MDINDLERIRQGNFSEQDIEKLRNVRTVMSIIKSATAVAVLLYVLLGTPIFKSMSESGSDMLRIISGGMKILLILMIVIAAISLVKDILMMIFIHNGMADSGFGHRYIVIAEAAGSCTGNFIQIVMGALLVIFACFALKDGAANPAEGDTVEGLYIVSVVFIIAGGGLVLAGVISVVKTIIKVVRGG